MKRIVIIGGGLAGLRAAEQLGRLGHDGEIVVVGAEPLAPYNRPPLSKEALRDDFDESRLPLPTTAGDSITFRLGVRAVTLGADLHSLVLADGSRLEADGLVIATGVQPRRILRGDVATHVVRTPRDTRRLRAQLTPAARLLVVGAGFLGCEIASSAAARGCRVTVVEPAAQPVGPHLGELLGAELRRRHEANGVQFRLGRTIVSLTQHALGAEAVLDDGSTVHADVVVEAVGCLPDLDWLAGSGFDLTNGILCDAQLRAIHPDRSAAVVAAGDCARFPLPGFDEVPRRIEHWNLAFDSARVAAHTLMTLLGELPAVKAPPSPLPSFWSDQAGSRVDCFGIPSLGLADCRLLEGDLADEAAIGYHGTDGRLVAVALLGMRRRVPYYRNLMTSIRSQPAVSSE